MSTSSAAGYRVITTLDWKAQKLAERWLARRRDRPEHLSARRRRPCSTQLKIPSSDRTLDQRPARQGPPQRRARRPRLPDRRRPRLRRQRRLRPRRHRQQGVRAEVRRRRRRGPPARLGLEADPLRLRVRRQAADPGQRAARRHDRVRPRPGLGPARRRPAGARTRPRAATPSSTRSTSPPSGPSSGSAASASPRRPRRMGIRFTGGSRGVPAGRPGGCARHGRGPPARPDLRVRDPRQRRRSGAAADGPRDPRCRTARSSGSAPKPEGERAVSAQAAFLVERHPGRQHRPAPERHLGREAGHAQRAGRVAPTGGRQDRHHQRRPRPGHVRLPAGIRQGRRRVGRRRVDGQQRPLLPVIQQARHLADRGGAPVACLRPRLHEGLEGREVQPAEGRRLGHDRRLVRWPAGRLDARHHQGMVHQAARSPGQARRSTRTASCIARLAVAGGSIRSRPSSGPAAWKSDVQDWLRRARRGVGVSGQI